jgi:hypothetical protein
MDRCKRLLLRFQTKKQMFCCFFVFYLYYLTLIVVTECNLFNNIENTLVISKMDYLTSTGTRLQLVPTSSLQHKSSCGFIQIIN